MDLVTPSPQSRKTSPAEGWAVDYPDRPPLGWWNDRPRGRRFPRRQHYFRRGRSLCGKRERPDEALSRRPLGDDAGYVFPPCAKCARRSPRSSRPKGTER